MQAELQKSTFLIYEKIVEIIRGLPTQLRPSINFLAFSHLSQQPSCSYQVHLHMYHTWNHQKRRQKPLLETKNNFSLLSKKRSTTNRKNSRNTPATSENKDPCVKEKQGWRQSRVTAARRRNQRGLVDPPNYPLCLELGNYFLTSGSRWCYARFRPSQPATGKLTFPFSTTPRADSACSIREASHPITGRPLPRGAPAADAVRWCTPTLGLH